MFKSSFSSRRRLALIVAFLATFAIVLNVTTYALYRRARTHLDNELGERLRGLASVLAHTVETAAGDSLIGEADELYPALYLIRDENLLSNIVLLTPDGTTLLDLTGSSEIGEPNPFIELDFSAITLARSGIPSYTELYRTGDVFMKSAYAPVMSMDGTLTGIVGVEAGAGFFAELRGLSGVILSISLGSLLVVAILGVIFYRQTRSLDRAQEAIIQRENLATMGRMVANIAHEIRNPLSIIRTSADRIRRKHGIDDEAVDYITEEVDELNRVLTGYLEFANPSRPADFAPQSGKRILTRSLLAAHTDAQEKSVTIVEALPDHDVMINGDEKRLHQAVINVLINAVQATGSGGRVEVSLSSSDGRAVIMVTDSGEGISAGDLARVTDPFFTTKTGGSGLGLSVVKTIVDDHGGQFEISSRPDQGTEVTLSFPLARS